MLRYKQINLDDLNKLNDSDIEVLKLIIKKQGMLKKRIYQESTHNYRKTSYNVKKLYDLHLISRKKSLLDTREYIYFALPETIYTYKGKQIFSN